MWFKRETNKNRRLHRHHVLDVKLRSDQVQATRLRLGLLALIVPTVTVLALYLVWRIGEATLNAFVYQNADFAIQQIDVRNPDGMIAPEQIRRWTMVKPGANLIALDLASVKRNLELVSVIDSVSVERVLPRTLKISVTERYPIAQVNVPRADGANGIAVSVFQLDADGMVMKPLDPRFCTVPLAKMSSQLPVIAGLNAFQVQDGRRMELPQVQAALRLIVAFEHSPMNGFADLRRVDVSAPGVIVATTGQGSEVTFGLDNLDQQFQRWRQIYDLGQRQQRAIASVDLAVANNVPVRWMLASAAPVSVTPKAVKLVKNRRKNV